MLNVNDIVEGKVTGITVFGAFVQIEEGKSGLIHISEISTGYVSDINDFLVIGQEVKAVVLSVEKDGSKLSLSLKKYLEDHEGKKADKRDDFKKTAKKERVFYESPPPMIEPLREDSSFEDKLNKFMKDSDEKLSALKKNTDSKRGGGYVRRG